MIKKTIISLCMIIFLLSGCSSNLGSNHHSAKDDSFYSYGNNSYEYDTTALGMAKRYLRSMPFSYNGLVEQLEYEGFTHSEALSAADNCGADWKEQAVLKATSYLKHLSFSRQGLIDQLPKTNIQTDSYVAVQLIEKENALGFDAIRNMAEKTEGSFCYTILDQNDNLYIVKGDNPMAIYKFNGFYLYASTDEILTRAVKKIGLKNYSKINISCGDILRITPNGTIEIQTFNFKDRYLGAWGSYYGYSSIDPYEAEDLFIDEITEYAGYFGIDPDDVMMLLEYGYDELEIEEMLYDPLEMQKCISEIKLCEMMC